MMNIKDGAILHTKLTGAHALQVPLADRFMTRFRGLMFKENLPKNSGLLLKRCASVHTAFMRFAIDVLYLDDRGCVLKCVQNLKPWRASSSGVGVFSKLRAGGVHTLELSAGSIQRMQLNLGDRLEHAAFPAPPQINKVVPQSVVPGRQRGAAMVEFVVVGPLITLIGMAAIQYGLLFNAKNVINHATFMAARAGSVGNADIGKIRLAYTTALLPLYGGGKTLSKRTDALKKAVEDVALTVRIELLNPTKESFDDWNDPKLQAALKLKKRIIPNANLAYKLGDATAATQLGVNHSYKNFNGEMVKSSSGQSLADANLIKLRITHGYEPKVPLMGVVFTKFLQWMDPKNDAFHTALITAGRIPVVSHVTVQMQSDAIESDNPVSLPGEGNHGKPEDPGEAPLPTEPPPDCATAGCSVESDPKPTDPGGGGESGGACKPKGCPECDSATVSQSLSADALFAFGKSSLADMLPAGKADLDKLIEYAKSAGVTGAKILGYTDPLGADALNQKLSLDRAQTVRDYLQQHGFPAVKIEAVGMGETEKFKAMSACQKMTTQQQIDCLQPNRRVEVELQGVK